MLRGSRKTSDTCDINWVLNLKQKRTQQVNNNNNKKKNTGAVETLCKSGQFRLYDFKNPGKTLNQIKQIFHLLFLSKPSITSNFPRGGGEHSISCKILYTVTSSLFLVPGHSLTKLFQKSTTSKTSVPFEVSIPLLYDIYFPQKTNISTL